MRRRRSVCYKFADVSKEQTAHIFRVGVKKIIARKA
jgi:hypothetical protein